MFLDTKSTKFIFCLINTDHARSFITINTKLIYLLMESMCHKAVIYLYIYWNGNYGNVWKILFSSPFLLLHIFWRLLVFFPLSRDSWIQHIKKFNTMRLLFINLSFSREKQHNFRFFLLKIYKRCQTLWRKQRFNFFSFFHWFYICNSLSLTAILQHFQYNGNETSCQ